MNKTITVLAMNDHAEAMRVASGLTIFGHHVNCIFTDRQIEENQENIENAELLEMCEITPYSLLEDPNIEKISNEDFLKIIDSSHEVMSI